MRKAFTLVELLIVIAILAVLSVVVFVIINPGQRIADARNATVRNDAQTVQKAFELYAVDNGGAFPDTDAGDDLVTDFSSSSLPTASCTEDIHGSTVTAADLSDFITEVNDFVPEYLSEESASSLTDAKVFYYTPAQQIVVCNPLADATAYNYPEVSGGGNLVVDGDMEAADTSAWDSVVEATLTKEISAPHGGNRSLRITSNAPDDNLTVWQYGLEIGKTYRVSGYARGDENGGYPRVYLNGSPYFNWNGTTSTEWQYFEGQASITGANTRIRIYGISLDAGEYVEFDDIVVTEVP